MSSPRSLGVVVAFFSFLVRIPFLFRYDLHFGGDSAICYLMSLRITHGDRPMYFYGQDYQGSPEAYAGALVLQLLGPSIPAAALVSLLEWSLAAGIGAALVARATDTRTAVICAVAIVVGAPFTLHYTTVPYWGYPGSLLIAMCLLLQADHILRRGFSAQRLLIFGASIGFGLYVGKQCLPAIAAAILVIGVSARSRPRHAIHWPLALAAMAAGFLVGYAPEWWYRLQVTETRSFVATVSAATIWTNAKFTILSILAYFNAQPVSRVAHGTNFFGHFFSTLPDTSSFPDGPLDWLATMVAAASTLLAVAGAWTARKNPPLLMLSLLVVINLFAVVFSNDTHGLFLSARRYLFTSAIAFSIWGGVAIAFAARHNQLWIRAAGLAIGVLLATKVAVDEYALLRSPDELAELRRMAAELIDEGVSHGIASGQADELVAITNERLKLVSLIYARIPEYVELTAAQDRIVVISEKVTPVESVTWNGAVYDPAGPSHQSEILRWTLYRKRSPQ